MGAGSRIRHVTKQFLWFVPAGITFSDLVASVIRIDGLSMQPTLNPADSPWSDWVLVQKFSIKLLRQYSRGDVVILLSPDEPNERLVKRVIALEGDMLKLEDTSETIRIPQGRCWIEGDNQQNSGDSRTSYGPVHLGLLEGRVSHVIWPPWRIGAVESFIPTHRAIAASA